MSTTDTIYQTKVKWKGTFDFEGLYLRMKEWLQQEGFSSPYEKLYVVRVKPQGNTIEIVWESTKSEDNDFFKYQLDIEFNATGLQDGQVTLPDGVSIAANTGTMEISFKATMTQNANESWKENTLMYKLYKRHILSDRIDDKKIDLYKKTIDMVEETKNFIQLHKL